MSQVTLPLVKAHGYGNDFLLVPDGMAAGIRDMSAFAARVCDRHRGLGADGLILLERTDAGARTQLFNADGSRSEVSGNGTRCVGAWLAATGGLTPGAVQIVETEAGPKRLELLDVSGRRWTFRADMGAPTDLRRETLDVAGRAVDVVTLRVGNPQCVVLGEVNAARLHALGAALAVHPRFEEGTNVELARVESPERVEILIWERGVGPTEASGTGACASAVAAAAYGGAARSVDVVSPGGIQRVDWTAETIWLTGWAEIVADAQWWL